MLERLLQCKDLDVNMRYGEPGNTVLVFAAVMKLAPFVNYLLKCPNIDIHAQCFGYNKAGKTPREYAANCDSNEEVVELLLEAERQQLREGFQSVVYPVDLSELIIEFVLP